MGKEGRFRTPPENPVRIHGAFGVLSNIRKGYEIKRIWEEQAEKKTGYANFWKYLRRTCPSLLKDSVTLRDFVPGGHTEVDWAGKKVRWVDESGKTHRAHLFLGILCYSQCLQDSLVRKLPLL